MHMNDILQSRRTLLKAAAALSMAAVPWGLHAAPSRRLKNIGLHLYTLRREMAQDFTGTLAKVAALGYSEMEFAGYFDKSSKEVRQILDQLGMTSPATHIPLPMIRDNLETEIETALIIGQKYMVVPFIPPNERTLDHYHRNAELLNRAGEACKSAGLQMGYHNHNFEFAATDSQIPYDILLAETDPELVAMEMDLFWIMYAGVDPIPYFKKHPGRFAMLHVKDMDSSRRMVDVGSGSIDFAELFSYRNTAGFKHYFVEHDNPGGRRSGGRRTGGGRAGDGLTSVAASIKALRNLVF